MRLSVLFLFVQDKVAVIGRGMVNGVDIFHEFASAIIVDVAMGGGASSVVPATANAGAILMPLSQPPIWGIKVYLS